MNAKNVQTHGPMSSGELPEPRASDGKSPSHRVSHSVLDPFITVPLKRFYPWLPIPRRLPPEAIVVTGHLMAMVGAIGFAYSASSWWGGLLAAFGVSANHLADVYDGTHARATGQCRNGGELLDHFFDPISFAYYLTGLAVGAQRLDLGIVAVILLFATAVLTNIRAKMIGEFTLASFGPTEFKTLLVVFGLAMCGLVASGESAPIAPTNVLSWILAGLLPIGAVQLAINLLRSIQDVNRQGAPPDTSEWEMTRNSNRAE